MPKGIKKTDTVPAVAVSDEQSITEIVQDENQLVKQDADIDGFIAKRQAFIQKVNAICVEGKDFHVIQGRKSLAKGGAEKIASIFHWTAKFEKDAETIEMLGDINGLVAFKCTLVNGQFVGEGRGAALLSKNSSDPNRTIKMAQKSAFIDGVLRASGLSDFFTQDLEDMNINEIGKPQASSYPNQTKSFPPSDKQIELIQSMMLQKRLTEENIMDEGFDLKNLTGGREGTASELINFLKTYIPKTQVTVQINGLTEDANKMIEKLNQCKDPGEFQDLTTILTQYRKEGRFTKEDLIELKKVYEKNQKEIMPQE